MAAASALAHLRRKKPATYGKSSRKVSAWNVSNLDALGEHQLSTQSQVRERTDTKRDSSGEEKLRALKPVRARATKQQDTWDVPSSDDEVHSPIRVTSPPKSVPQKRSHIVTEESETKLAPWERKDVKEEAESNSRSEKSRTGHGSGSPEEQLNMELSRTLAGSSESQKTPTTFKSDLPEGVSRGSPVSSTAAKLQAKRLRAGRDAASSTDGLPGTYPGTQTQKRAILRTDGGDSKPKKRPRSEIQQSDSGFDAFMTDVISGPSGKLLKDSNTPETPSRSPSAPVPVSRPLTPRPDAAVDNPPPPANTEAMDSHDAPGTMTPKQAHLWKQILPTETVSASPSLIPIQRLNINSSKRPTQTALASTPTTPYSGAVSRHEQRRPRLVDRLKASTPGSDLEMSEQSEAESEPHDQGKPGCAEMDEPLSSQQSQGQNQSQSQASRAADGGPRITYARDRSYLREESFEEGLMLELADDTPQRPTGAAGNRRKNAKQASKKSAFDMDDSDDEAGAGRLRTVHELRAGGGNQRFMDDIGGMLDDIADHNISARSRRRTALMEIATKLSDRAFAEKFARQGFEQQLASECGSTPDEIADFATTAGLVTLMAGDLSEHAAQSLRDSDYLQALVRLLTVTTDARKLVKDRRYNMSKAAQSSFMIFVDQLADRSSIWGDIKPVEITPRLVALKAMEQLIQKLRRLGDLTELVAASEVELIYPSKVEQEPNTTLSTEVGVAVSVLESLSTSAHTLAWPFDLVRRLGWLLTQLRSMPDDHRHTLFLASRLCVNLTNGHVGNCKALSTNSTVSSLLHAIRTAFAGLDAPGTEEQRAVQLDVLVLSMGILMNLAEHDDDACAYARDASDADAGVGAPLGALVAVWQAGQKRVLEAESEEESAFNVAYGYLAVTLAQLCRDAGAKSIIASRLPGKQLHALVAGVEEFVAYHKDVDRLSFEGGEGMEVWGAFTEKLQGVLMRLKTEAGSVMAA